MAKAKRCTGRTTKGRRCRRGRVAGSKLCAIHNDTGGERPAYKFDDEKRTAYLQCLKAGMHRGRAAASVGVHRSTVAVYKKANPDFAGEVSMAEAGADGIVEARLFEKACGKGQGAVIASIFWLKNRQPDDWSDVKEVHVVEKLIRQEREKLTAALEAAGVTDAQLQTIDAVLNGDDTATAGSGAVH